MRYRTENKTEGYDMSELRATAGNGISLGVLIIGSLYWDRSAERRIWRRDHLDLNEKQYVRAPIRYGRRSQKRGRTYTMVFSESLSEADFGRAIVAASRSQDLVEAARSLWAAEGGTSGTSGTWGCVGLLRNRDSRLPTEQCERWRELVAADPHYKRLASAKDDPVAVEETGLLSIPWPKLADGSTLGFDALLATATRPTLDDGRYPTASDVAAAWDTPEGNSHVRYFCENRKNGIRTFQDDEIERHLRRLGQEC